MQNTKQELVLQAGQRTPGLVEIFAEGNNMTYQELRKLMEQGKTTTDMIVKAGLAAGKAADQMGTLAEAVKTGASAQQKWTNTMKWFSWAANKALDPAIAAFFNTLAEAVTLISTPFITLIKLIARAIENLRIITDVIGELWEASDKAKTALLAFSIAAVAALFLIVPNIGRAVSAVLLLEKAFLAARGAALLLARAAPMVMLLALIELTRQLHDYYMGKTNWVSVLAITFQAAFAKIDLGVARFELMMARMEYAAKNTFKVITGLKWSELADKISLVSRLANPTSYLETMKALTYQGGLTAEGKVTVDINVNDQNGTRQQTTTVPLNFTQSAAAQ